MVKKVGEDVEIENIEDVEVEQLAELGTKFARANELPDVFVAEVVDVRLRPDAQGRQCVFLRLKLSDGAVTVVKYTPMHIPELAAALKKLGFKRLGELKGALLTFKKQHFRIGFPRPIPAERVKAK